MNKITNFYQQNKKVVLGLLIAGTTSAIRTISVYLFKYFTTKSVQNPPKMVKEASTVQNIQPSVSKLALTKDQMLDIISKIKKACNEDLKFLRNNYRFERRKLFYDEEAYQQLLEDYDSKLLQILESTSNEVIKEYKITNATFEKLVKAYNDEEINIAVDSMATVEEECEAPAHITKDLLLEIFNYNNKRCNASVLESNKNFEYLNTRIQDEIYFKYKIEVEELSACYRKFDCDHDPDFLPKIDEMQRSVSAHYNS